MSGVALIAFTVSSVLGAFAAGHSLGRHRHCKRIPMAGLAIAVMVLVALAHEGPVDCRRSCLLFLCGGGIGTMYPVTTIVIQNAVLPHQFGVATGTLNFCRLLGGTIVVAALGAIVLGQVGASGGLVALDRLSHSGMHAPAGLAADFASVFAWVFAAAGACILIALVALAFIEERPLRGRAPAPPAGEQAAPLAAE